MELMNEVFYLNGIPVYRKIKEDHVRYVLFSNDESGSVITFPPGVNRLGKELDMVWEFIQEQTKKSLTHINTLIVINTL